MLESLGLGSLLMLIAIATASGAILYYVQTTLTQIREGLPVEVMRQERDVSRMVQLLAELRYTVEVAQDDPSSAHLDAIRERLDSARSHLESVRDSYNLDNLVGASAMHAAARPALDDAARWLDEGLHGRAPGSELVLGLVEQRIDGAYREVRDLSADSTAAALSLLERESARLESFRNALSLVFAFVAAVTAALAVFIMRQRRSERRATLARERLHEAINSIDDGFALFDPNGCLVLCNDRYAGLYPGISADVRPGRSFQSMVRESVAAGDVADAAEDPEGWLARRLASFRSPDGVPFEVRLSDGRVTRISERRTADGGLVAIMTDMTELRRGESELRAVSEELRHNNMLLDAALANMGQGLAMFDANQRLIVCNQRYLEIYNFPPECGRPGTALVDLVRRYHSSQPETAEEIERIVAWRLDIARAREETNDVEFLGDGRVVDIHHRPMPDGGSLATYEDITERYRAQEALRHAKEDAEIASRAKSDFLANVSHELRTPLNAVIGFSEILEGQMFGPLGDRRYKAYAHDIRESGEHLLSLINDILDLSKVEAGKYAIRDEEVALAAAVGTCIRIVGERADSGGVRIHNLVPIDVPSLRGDGRAIKQILLNLMTNAVKFTQRGGQVEVSSEHRDDGSLLIRIADTGIGIEPRDVEKALAPFGQVDSALSRKYEGTGLGLPLTKRLVELHGGWLDLDSAPGEGTTATVGFPPDRVVGSLARASGQSGS